MKPCCYQNLEIYSLKGKESGIVGLTWNPSSPTTRRPRKEDRGKFEATLAYSKEEEEVGGGEGKRGGIWSI